MIGTSHLYRTLDPFYHKMLVDKTVELINNRVIKGVAIETKAIVFTGMSGAALAYPVSYLTGIPLICVRKAGIKTHSTHWVESGSAVRDALFEGKPISYIILDDLIDSGASVKRIQRYMRKETPMKCQGIVVYNDPHGYYHKDAYFIDMGNKLPVYRVPALDY
jgi:adenine/guanine phosphoribosyltransferase-like PRPP-binding protein